MMRLLALAAVCAGLALAGASLAVGADLDYPYGAPRPRPRIYEAPAPVLAFPPRRGEPIYTRPVVGFYGYPFDYGVPAAQLGRSDPARQEPFLFRRDDPHGVAVE